MKGFPAVALLALLLGSGLPALVSASGIEVSAGAQASGGTETTATASVSVQGPVFVDPILEAGFAIHTAQVAILRTAPGTSGALAADLGRRGILHHELPELSMVAAVLSETNLTDLLPFDGLLSVYRNERMAPQLSRSVPYVGANVLWTTYQVRGKGATILIVDSGVDGSHPDVRFRDVLIENVVPVQRAGGLIDGYREGVPASDPDGHGTHAASIAAGQGRGGTGGANAGRYRGVAPEARLIGFQAGLRDGEGEVAFESLTVLEAFNYALAKRRTLGIDIVSNSWGTNGDFDPQSPINQATLNLYKAGLLVVFAAGNEGKDGAHTLNKYAVAPWVLGVTAGDYLNQIPAFASRGVAAADGGAPYDHPDLVAPGVGITAAKAMTDPPRAGVAPNPGEYTSKSGTSMSAPHVAGIAALLLSANPNLSPDDLMDILTATATPVSYGIDEGGAGFVNGLKAYQLAERTKGSRDSFVAGRVKYAGRESGDPEFERDAVSVGYGSGTARQIGSMDRSLEEFGRNLVSTAQGIVFLGGVAVLSAAAFGFRRRPTYLQAAVSVRVEATAGRT